MKFKLLASLLMGAAVTASAQGYRDGVEYYRVNMPQEAEIILNRTLNDPTTAKAEAYYVLGQIALNNGDTAKAAQLFNQGVAADSEDGLNYVGLGLVAAKQGNADEQKVNFKKAQDLGKKDVEVLTELARAYYAIDPVKNKKDIAKLIERARKVDASDPTSYIFEADMMADDKNVGEAAGYYEMAIGLDSDNTHPEAYVKYANTYMPVDRNVAIDVLERLLKAQPNSALAQNQLAEAYYNTNQLRKAAKQYGEYINNPNSFDKDRQRYVFLLYYGEDYQASYDLASQLLAKDPDNIFMQRMQLYDLVAMKKWPEAEKYAEKLFTHDSKDFTAMDYTTYADILQHLDKDSLAVYEYEKAVKLAPDKADLYNDLSAAYATVDELDKSIAAVEKYLELKGTPDALDYYRAARRYRVAAAKTDDEAKRQEYVRKGVAAIDNSIANGGVDWRINDEKSTLFFIGNQAHANQDVVDNDIKTLSILDSKPDNVTENKDAYLKLYTRIGSYYLTNDDKATAAEYLNKALALSPDDASIIKLVELTK